MRKWLIYFVIIFQIILIISLIKGIFTSLQSKERIEELENRKEDLVGQKQELEGRLQEVQSPDYLEKVAREELHLAKPGEKVVIVPEGIIKSTTDKLEDEKIVEKANWQKWWEVLRGKVD